MRREEALSPALVFDTVVAGADGRGDRWGEFSDVSIDRYFAKPAECRESPLSCEEDAGTATTASFLNGGIRITDSMTLMS